MLQCILWNFIYYYYYYYYYLTGNMTWTHNVKVAMVSTFQCATSSVHHHHHHYWAVMLKNLLKRWKQHKASLSTSENTPIENKRKGKEGETNRLCIISPVHYSDLWTPCLTGELDFLFEPFGKFQNCNSVFCLPIYSYYCSFSIWCFSLFIWVYFVHCYCLESHIWISGIWNNL